MVTNRLFPIEEIYGELLFAQQLFIKNTIKQSAISDHFIFISLMRILKTWIMIATLSQTKLSYI